ncbi:3-hydroxy-3-methylglutaryl coenzyme A reductase 2-A-like [Cornus florida]|uniref:3-hydroxy-3-methylglutaryl coenzyme A reductase 2-A-like n=1 Tax=Cornus florida TaxID=4283 RepID=UPI0028A2B934|nr:3-hydroxy-3-methylglutaryl coenzyme A reductase 2-A-like [Cornus florida]
MDVRRPQSKSLGPSKTLSAGGPLKPHQLQSSSKASDALPLPLYLTNGIFFTLFFSVAYFLLHLWREKIRTSTPLHIVTLSELAAVVSLFASVMYLLGFFGIDFVQFITRGSDVNADQTADDFILEEETRRGPCAAADIDCSANVPVVPPQSTAAPVTEEDEEIIKSVVAGLAGIEAREL